MKIMSIGAGFVSDHLPYERINERVTSMSSVTRSMLQDYKPDVLVNCIGKTGRPNVDWCESHKAETAFANITIPMILADECSKLGIHLIQIGSGCIFFGESPSALAHYHMHSPSSSNYPYKTSVTYSKPGWKETDFANPKSFYSKTKYACDLAIGDMAHVTTLRIRMPVSSKNTPRNFINKVRGYNQVIDIQNSMTFMDDLVRCIDWAARNKKTGIYHVTNPEPLTAAQIMREYRKHVPDHTFEIITESQLDNLTAAKRSNCILDSSKLANAGFTMMPSKKALEICMAEYIKNI